MASYLDAFSIRVRKRAAKSANKLDSYDGSGKDFASFLDRFLSSLDVTTSHDQRFRGLLTVDSRTADPARRTITGTLLAGHYGRISRFVDINTNDNVFSRKKHHAEAIPFLFKVFTPKGQDEGIAVIQRTGTASPIQPLKYFLLKYFRESTKNLVLEFQALVNKKELDEMLLRSTTDQIRISNFHLRSRVEEIQDQGYHQEVKTTLVIKQRAHEERGVIRNFIRGLAETRQTGIAEIDEHIDADSKIKISIEENGQTHLIDLNSPRIRLNVGVDEFSEGDPQAYRTYVEAEADKFLESISTRLWGENSNVWKH